MPEVIFTIEAYNLDCDGTKILPSAFKNLPTKVKILRDFNAANLIGTGEAFNEDNVLKLKTSIDDDFFDLTPAVGFQAIKTSGDIEVTIIEDAKLFCVSLGASNTDPSIKTIREQIS